MNLRKLFREFAATSLDKEIFHFAASLSFYTLLAFIPFTFISLSLFLGMPSFSEYYAKIKNFVFSNLLPANQDALAAYLDQFLSNSQGLGIVGSIAIIITSILFFSDYEYTVSKLTHTPQRSFWQGLSAYWTLITLLPLALGLSFWLSSLIQNALESSEFTSKINFLAIFPYLIIWAIFAAIYLVSIHKPLNSRAVLISSMTSSAIWEVSKRLFIEYAFYNKTYESIYGSFSVLLFFFLWIYLSWIVFLFGAKLCAILSEEE